MRNFRGIALLSEKMYNVIRKGSVMQMNQDSNDMNQNYFNTQGKNGIHNNQIVGHDPQTGQSIYVNSQSMNNNVSTQQFVQNSQVNNNVIQNNGQVVNPTTQQTQQSTNTEYHTSPSTNTLEGGSVNNSGFNKKSSNKRKLILIVGICVVVVIIMSVILCAVLGNNKTTEKTPNRIENEVSYTHFSESTDTNNLSVPLRWGMGHYVIKLNGEGLGESFSKKYEKIDDIETYIFYNDSIKILSYFNAKSDPEIRIYNLWGYGYMAIGMEKYNHTYIEGETEYIQYTTIEKNNNYYLVSNKWKSMDDVTYYIKIVLDDDVVEIYLGNIELNLAKDIFNKFVTSTEICYIPLDDEMNVLSAVNHENAVEKVDTSNWTFVQDIIGDFYKERGVRIKNTTYITAFNSTSYRLSTKNAIYFSPVFDFDGKLMTAGFTIRNYSKSDYENIVIEEKRGEYSKKIYADMKTIKLKPFKNSHVYEVGGEATLFVETDQNKYYYLGTGITYKSEKDNEKYTQDVIDIMEQLFN